jgi:hypothetical protein
VAGFRWRIKHIKKIKGVNINMSEKISRRRSALFVMNDPYPLRISGQLATEIGFNESVLLLQIEYLISISNTEMREGKLWTYQSLDDLRGFFPWWGRETINRTIHRLCEMELILIGNFNQRKGDHTRWFALNPVGIQRLKSVRLDMDVVGSEGNRRSPKVSESQNGIRSPKRKIKSHFETGESQNETGESQNETTLPETPTRDSDKDSSAAAIKNNGVKKSETQTESAAAVDVISENKPDDFEQPNTIEGWSLDNLFRHNTVSSKKANEMRRAGVTGAAFASWIAEAFSRQGIDRPIALAVVSSIDHPTGAPGVYAELFARPCAEVLALLARSIAGYPVTEPVIRKLSTEKRRALYLALGGNESDIPAQYVPPIQPVAPKPAEPEAPTPVEVPEHVRARMAEIRARMGKG